MKKDKKKNKRSERGKSGKKEKLVYTTRYSQLVTHPVPNPTDQGLISCDLRQV